MSIRRWASLPGDTVLQPYSIEAWILENNPGARGVGAEKDSNLCDRLNLALEGDNPPLSGDFTLRHEKFDKTIDRLQRAGATLDFTFADYCGGVGLKERETIKTAFEITRPGGIVVVTSGIGFRGTGGYWELYGHDEDNKLCLSMELMSAAWDARKDVASPAVLPYKSANDKGMFSLVFTVK
jgi:hypothetical protein